MRAAMTIYCSGPLFSPEEVAAMTVIARALEGAGFRTFLPHRDGIEAWVLPFAGGALDRDLLRLRDAIDRAIFALDVFQLAERCDALVFNANGRVPDEGAVAEAALAFAVGKPVILYKRDARSVFHGRDNAMVTGLCAASVRDLGALPAAVDSALARSTGGVRPPALAATIERGRRLWTVLERANRLRGAARPSAELVDEIATLAAG